MTIEKLPNESIFGFYEGNDTAYFTDLNGGNLNKAPQQLLENDRKLHHLLDALDQVSDIRLQILEKDMVDSHDSIPMGDQILDSNWDGITYLDTEEGLDGYTGQFNFHSNQSKDKKIASIKKTLDGTTTLFLDDIEQSRTYNTTPSGSKIDWINLGQLTRFKKGSTAVLVFANSAGNNTNKKQQSFIKLHITKKTNVSGFAINESYGLNAPKSIRGFVFVEDGDNVTIYANRSANVTSTYTITLVRCRYHNINSVSFNQPKGSPIEIYNALNTTNGGHTSKFDADLLDGLEGTDYVKVKDISNSITSDSTTTVSSSKALKTLNEQLERELADYKAQVDAEFASFSTQVSNDISTTKTELTSTINDVKTVTNNTVSSLTQRVDAVSNANYVTMDQFLSVINSRDFFPSRYWRDPFKLADNQVYTSGAGAGTGDNAKWYTSTYVAPKPRRTIYPQPFKNDTSFNVRMTFKVTFSYNLDAVTLGVRILFNGSVAAQQNYRATTSSTLSASIDVAPGQTVSIRCQAM